MKLSIAFSALMAVQAAAFMPNAANGIQTSMEAVSGSKGTGEGWIDPSAPVNSEKSLKLTLKKSLEGSSFQKRLSILGSTGSRTLRFVCTPFVLPTNEHVVYLTGSIGTQTRM